MQWSAMKSEDFFLNVREHCVCTYLFVVGETDENTKLHLAVGKLRSVQNSILVLGKAHACSAPSLRSFP